MTTIVYDPIFLQHDTGYHVENALRLGNTTTYLQESGLWDRFGHLSPRAATPEEIQLVHSSEYIKSIKDFCSYGGGHLNPDTVVSESSYSAAIVAVGALLDACDLVQSGKDKNAFCLVRPPGHHALPERSMGFCLFNNVAVAARYLQKKHGLKKIAIVDFDIHHGNGTQDIFFDDASVFYLSVHRFPFFPGSGSESETGVHTGKGATLNFPLSHSAGETEYLAALETGLRDGVIPFQPEFVLVSAGFDAYEHDPLGGLGITVNGFLRATELIVNVAKKVCGGKIVSALEGGYNPADLPLCIAAHLKALLHA